MNLMPVIVQYDILLHEGSYHLQNRHTIISAYQHARIHPGYTLELGAFLYQVGIVIIDNNYLKTI